MTKDSLTGIWRMIDESSFCPYIEPDDQCLFFLDYTAGSDYTASEVNSFIKNLKITPAELREQPYRKRYKEDAIDKSVSILTAFLQWFTDIDMHPSQFILSSIPPSKEEASEDHDDRMERISRRVADNIGFKYHKLITTKQNRKSLHTGGQRTPESVIKTLKLNDNNVPDEAVVFLIDDVIVKGTTFKACQKLLLSSEKSLSVIGLFLACAMYK